MAIRFSLDDGAVTPTRGSKGAAGYDLYLSKACIVPVGAHEMAYTGVHVEVPFGCVGLVFVRSSVGANRHVTLSNAVGVIDSDYRGPIGIPLYNAGTTPQFFEKGERVAQLVIVRALYSDEVQVVDALPDTERGEGGFGSTGRK